MSSVSATLRSRSSRFASTRFARRILFGGAALTGLAVVIAACSVAPGDDAASSGSDLSLPTPPITPPILRTPVGWNAAWEDTGLTDVSGAAPLATSWGPNRLDLFTRVGTGLAQKSWWGTTWAPAGASGWNLAVPDGLASDPAGMGWGGSKIDLVWRDAQNALEHMFWDTAVNKWSFENLSGTFAGRPSIVIAPDGSRGDVFVRVGTGVWHRGWAYVPNNWTEWEPLSFQVTDDPVAVSDAAGKIDVFYRGTDGSTNFVSWDGTTTGSAHVSRLASMAWTTHPTLSGYLEGSASVVASGPGQVQVAGVGGDGGVWVNATGNGGQSWSGWSELNGCARSAQVAFTAWATDHQDLFATSSDTGTLMHKVYGASPSAAPGLVPICCAQEGQKLSAVDVDPFAIMATVQNQDNLPVTFTATNAANAADTRSGVAQGQGAVSYTFTGLTPMTKYTVTAHAGSSASACGTTSEAGVMTTPPSVTFTPNNEYSLPTGGKLGFNAHVTVNYTGVVTWDAQVYHNGDYDLAYDLQILFPNVSGLRLDGNGVVDAPVHFDSSTDVNPTTNPINAPAQTALIRAQYENLVILAQSGGALGFTMSEMPVYPAGYTGAPAQSFCPSGGAVTPIDVCCTCSGDPSFYDIPEPACDGAQALARATAPGTTYNACVCESAKCSTIL